MNDDALRDGPDRSGPESIIITDISGRQKKIDPGQYEVLHKGFGRCMTLSALKTISGMKTGLLLRLAIAKARQISGGSIEELEYASMYHEFIGIEPARIDIRFAGQDYSFDARCPSVSPLMFLFHQVAVCDQYSAGRTGLQGLTVIDAGANVGVFAIFAARLGAKKVHAFEPVKETYEQLCRNIRSNRLEGVIVPHRLALGDRKRQERMRCKHPGDAGARITEGPAQEMETVGMDTLDGFLGGSRVDFIKMDIEGCEARALIGAQMTIREHKPVLAFSAYHRPEDKVELPQIVKGIRPDYTCTLTKYGEEDYLCR